MSSLTFEASGVLRNDGAEAGLDVRRQIGAHVDVVDVKWLGVDALVGVGVEPSSKFLLPKWHTRGAVLLQLLLVENDAEIYDGRDSQKDLARWKEVGSVATHGWDAL